MGTLLHLSVCSTCECHPVAYHFPPFFCFFLSIWCVEACPQSPSVDVCQPTAMYFRASSRACATAGSPRGSTSKGGHCPS